MKISSKRILSILGSMFLVIAAMAVFTYVIGPAYDDISKKKSEVASLRKLKDQYDASVNRIQDLKNKYQSVLEAQDSISSLLPTSEDTPEALNQIVNSALVNRLSVESFSVKRESLRASSNSALSREIGVLSINLRVSGSYENFRSYLANLETNINLIDVKDVTVGGSSGESTSANLGKLAYSLTVETYYQAE